MEEAQKNNDVSYGFRLKDLDYSLSLLKTGRVYESYSARYNLKFVVTQSINTFDFMIEFTNYNISGNITTSNVYSMNDSSLESYRNVLNLIWEDSGRLNFINYNPYGNGSWYNDIEEKAKLFNNLF